jgi:hypothetical protein
MVQLSLLYDDFQKEEHDYLLYVNNKLVLMTNDESVIWDGIGETNLGDLYEVHSPTGKSIEQFIPF